MTTYYVSPNGNDANNGLGPDPTAGTNKPWKTLGKALGASGIASGDTVYVAPGTYRETITMGLTPAATTSVLGDPGNAQGFKDGSGVPLTGGEIVWSAFTTNDVSAPAGGRPLTLAGAGHLTFSDFKFFGGNVGNSCVDATTVAAGPSVTFRRCTFVSYAGNGAIGYTGTVDTTNSWLFDSCRMIGCSQIPVTLSLPTTGGGADYSDGMTFVNCFFPVMNRNGPCVRVNASGALANKGGGVTIYNCTFFGGGFPLQTNSANLSTTVPCGFYNNLCFGAMQLVANTTGQIVEDYNVFLGDGAPRSNVAVGANSKTNGMAALLEFDQEYAVGRLPRTLISPLAGFGGLGMGSSGSVTAPTTDYFGRPRPAGGGSASIAAGAMEYHDSGAKSTAVVDVGRTNSLLIAGPGDQELYVPVPAGAVTVGIKVNRDGSYGAGTAPKLVVLANGEVGVTIDQVTTDAGASGTFNLLSLAFTTTAAGVVKVRLDNTGSAAAGNTYWGSGSAPVLSVTTGTENFDYFLRGQPFTALTHDALASTVIL